MELVEVQGATGGLDTDFKAKVSAAVQALNRHEQALAFGARGHAEIYFDLRVVGHHVAHRPPEITPTLTVAEPRTGLDRLS
jgi:hypothetical protein